MRRDSTLWKLPRPDQLPTAQDSPLQYVVVLRRGTSQIPSSLGMETQSFHRAALASIKLWFKAASWLEIQLHNKIVCALLWLYQQYPLHITFQHWPNPQANIPILLVTFDAPPGSGKRSQTKNDEKKTGTSEKMTKKWPKVRNDRTPLPTSFSSTLIDGHQRILIANFVFSCHTCFPRILVVSEFFFSKYSLTIMLFLWTCVLQCGSREVSLDPSMHNGCKTENHWS